MARLLPGTGPGRAHTTQEGVIPMHKFEMRRWLILMAVLMLAFAVGCSDDDDPTGPGNGGDDAPTFDGPEAYTAPASMQTSSDPYAQTAYFSTVQIGLASTYLTWFNAPPGKAAADGPPWTQEWNFNEGGDNLTVSIVIDEQGDDWTWQVRFDGTMGGETYQNIVVYRARQAKNGSTGMLEVFNPATGNVVSLWAWDASLTRMRSFNGTMPATEMILTPDGSGGADLSIYTDGFQAGDGWESMAMSWDSAGNGSWTEYNEDGSVADSGVWP